MRTNPEGSAADAGLSQDGLAASGDATWTQDRLPLSVDAALSQEGLAASGDATWIQGGLPAPRSLPPVGSRIGHYELVRILGRGGMGTVFLARDTRLARLVALKVLTRLSGVGLQRFLVEAQATARCKHENIVTIHEANEHEGYSYMVLEYVEGRSLRAWMNEHKPEGAGEGVSTAPVLPSMAVEIVAPIVRALAHAHRSGIVHRDLKPENIMLDASGAIKVVDFGIAKLRDEDTSPPIAPDRAPHACAGLTAQGAFTGTLPYMSPEQWTGEGIDKTTDLWAVGILLHELVVGAHPLAPVSLLGLAEAMGRDEPIPPVHESHPELGALGAIIDRCLRKQKAERIASAEDLLAELTPLLPGRREALLRADESPFAGLSSFQEGDADRFFGRAQELAAVVTRLRNQPLLAIAGASGVGKSSLVRAGVIPALKRSGEGWASIVLRPGREPMATLADLFIHPPAALEPIAPPGGPATRDGWIERLYVEPGVLGAALRAWSARTGHRMVLFIDQFEELFTLSCPARERVAFLACLEGVADDASSPLRVVVSMRSDFLERMAEHQHFSSAMIRGLVLLAPMGREGLREALLRPVEAAQYRFDAPGMVERLLDALEGTRGALPLLQFTASKLWEMRDPERRLLTEASYRALGGVAGALAGHADTVLASMSAQQAKLARAVLERLVTPERTRAIASLSELRELPVGAGEAAGAGQAPSDEMDRVVQLLADARLISVETASESAASTVEIVHESLVDGWPRLKQWLDENQEDAEFLDRLRAAAKLWESSGLADDSVWRGKIAEEARRFRERHRGALHEREQRYLDAVLGLADRALRTRRRLLVGTIAALSVLVVAAAVGILTVMRQNRVITAQLDAIRRTEDTRKEALASEERARRESDAQRRRAEQLQRDAEEARDRAEAEAKRARAAAEEARTARDAARSSEAEARGAEAKASEEEQKARAAAEEERRSKREKEQLIERTVGKIRETLR